MLADVHADGLADGQLLADVAVDEALDNVFAVLDVDYYVVAEDHDGADRAGEVARAVDGNGDVLRTDGDGLVALVDEVHLADEGGDVTGGRR